MCEKTNGRACGSCTVAEGKEGLNSTCEDLVKCLKELSSYEDIDAMVLNKFKNSEYSTNVRNGKLVEVNVRAVFEVSN